MSLTLKVTSLAIRTLAKPIANRIKRGAHEHERFRRICVRFAQGLHRFDMRMRLGLLQDPAVIDRQIAKEVKAAEAARRQSQAPTVKTEAETIAEQNMTKQERDAAKKKVEAANKPRIRPLSEAKAIETGANFISEAFIFSVAVGVIVFEQWRQRRKAQNQRDDIREDLEEMQFELKSVKAVIEEMKTRYNEPKGGLLSRWKGKSSGQKVEDKPKAGNDTSPRTKTLDALQPPSKMADVEDPAARHTGSGGDGAGGLLSFWKEGTGVAQKIEEIPPDENKTSPEMRTAHTMRPLPNPPAPLLSAETK